ncbi:MAG: diaminopimelate epimerase [Candidatus Krumholzibacteriota bacterium]|nr:diaminopimelate epimerase [Candidatus Krumholzibacteriota bacterium]
MSDNIYFEKMHGAGNDFIMIDDPERRPDISPRLIESLCRLHTGIGADGLILIQPDDHRDFRMRYFNRDGGEAQMCGNGARCAALFAYNRKIAGKRMSFATGSGDIRAEILDDGVKILIGRVDRVSGSLKLEGSDLKPWFAICGVPHAMLLDEDVRKIGGERFLALARLIRNDRAFAPEGTNFNLVTVRGRHSLSYRTYERGVEDETLACGTGAVAISVITSKMGLTSSPVSCETSGGDILQVEFTLDDTGATDCHLSGPAVVSFTGTIPVTGYER